MRSKKLCSLLLATGMMLSSTACGLYKSSDNAGGTASAATEVSGTVTDTTGQTEGSTGEKVTLHHGSSEETAPEKNTDNKPEEDSSQAQTTEADKNEEGKTTSEKYLELMKLSREDACDYFDVTVNSELTAEDFDAFLEELFTRYLGNNVINIKNYYRDLSHSGVDEADFGYSLLQAAEEDAMSESLEVTMNDFKTMLSYPYSVLSDRQRLVYDKFFYEYLIALWSFEVTDYSSLFQCNNGFIPAITTAMYEFSFLSEQDIQYYDRIMENLPASIGSIYDLEMENVEKNGRYPTDYMLDTNIEIIEGLIETKNNPFIEAYNEKVDSLGLDEAVAKEYKDKNNKLYTDEIIPALKELSEKLQGLKGKNTEGKGLCEYEGGLEYYRLLVEDSVGNLCTMEEVFELLKNDLQEKYKVEMLAMLTNYSELEKWMYGNLDLSVIEESSPAELIRMIKETTCQDYVDLDLDYKVSELPESIRQDGILAYYLLPAFDSDENIIRYNPDNLEDSIVLLQTLAHEGYPGHMLQSNISKKADSYRIEKMISHLGYMEGWANYIERSSLDVLTKISSNTRDAIYADTCMNYDIYGIADIAINGFGWTDSKIVDYFNEIDIPVEESTVEYLRKVLTADPAVYLAYSAGRIVCEDIVEDYKAAGHTSVEACESYCSIGMASFNVVRKYMGIE